MEKGVKYDSKKLQWSLLPIKPIQEVVRVLMYGAKKYSPDNWKRVENPKERYYNAAMRHLTAWFAGSKVDPQTKKSHLVHAICCLIFLREFERKEKQ